MNKLSVKQILNHPELAQYIMPQNCALFLIKNRDYEAIANLANTSITDAFQRIMEMNEGKDLTQVLAQNSDTITTMEYAKSINDIFKENHSKLSADKLMLYVGYTAMRTLQAMNRVEVGQSVPGKEELFFQNGDYAYIHKGEISGDINGQDVTTIVDLKNRLARVVLIAASQFNINQKNKKNMTEIAGTFYHSGTSGEREKIRFSERQLTDFARSAEIIASMSNVEIGKAIDEGLIQKNTLLKHMEKGKINKRSAIDFLDRGIISEEDFIRRVHKKKNMIEVAEDPEIDGFSKLVLFDKGKINFDTFEKIADFSLAFYAYIFKKISIEDFQKIIQTKNLEPIELSFVKDWNLASNIYNDRPKEEVITDISELLTHNVFDYTQSMEYLRYMEDQKVITEEDRKYIEQLVQDFKTNELINNTENELIEVGGTGERKIQPHVPNLTIDPKVRMAYLKSLGAVKQLKVRGETFIQDSKENVVRRNSLDGYEMFIIPSKKIAILEKLYETTRDKEGNIQYRKNKNGELIPAVENATYIMPIEMAKEFTEKKNKRDLIRSPYVERSMHTADWVRNTERKIMNIRPEIEFEKENSKVWAERIKENYMKNRRKTSEGITL